MLSNISYPIVCTDKFKESVAFYEDFFGFVPVYEVDQYVILERQGYAGTYLAIIDVAIDGLPEKYRRNVSGMILSLPVPDIDAAYDDVYWEGLSIVIERQPAICGAMHFMVEDPNGILIDVSQRANDEVFSHDKNDTQMCMAV